MLDSGSLFSSDPGKFQDFSGISAADIFNRSVLARATEVVDIFGNALAGLDEAADRRKKQLDQDLASDLFRKQQDDSFLADRENQKSAPSILPENFDYNEPLPDTAPQKEVVATGDFIPAKIKLSNYGYDSDSSPDYNSNVAKIGHANNKLKDGLSAALTKSLAQRHGLKTGDMFEAIDANGKVYRRRYDDTVPTKYKGKKLPETVDLYEVGGRNNFGGTIVGIRPLKSKTKKLDLPSGDGNISGDPLPPKP